MSSKTAVIFAALMLILSIAPRSSSSQNYLEERTGYPSAQGRIFRRRLPGGSPRGRRESTGKGEKSCGPIEWTSTTRHSNPMVAVASSPPNPSPTEEWYASTERFI